MRALGKMLRKLAALTGRMRFDDELDEEMAFHKEQIEQELRDRGMSAEEAHYAAMRQFGAGHGREHGDFRICRCGADRAVAVCAAQSAGGRR
jgi:hypothetical protein